MGLTIHYSLQSAADDAALARRLVEQLHSHALTLPFDQVDAVVEFGSELGEIGEGSSLSRWMEIQAERHLEHGERFLSVPPLYAIAFTTRPGEGCEWANFGLCRYPEFVDVDGRRVSTQTAGWSWQSCCKTQYASNSEYGGVENLLRCHLAIVSLLDFAQSLGILKEVFDEGGYWDKRDAEDFTREVGRWNNMMAAFVGGMKDAMDVDFTAEITNFPDFEHLEAKGRESIDNPPRE